MYGKGRVNGDLFPQFFCQFLTRGLLHGEITFEGKKAQYILEDIFLALSDGCCVLVVSNFSLPRLYSLVVCLQLPAI